MTSYVKHYFRAKYKTHPDYNNHITLTILHYFTPHSVALRSWVSCVNLLLNQDILIFGVLLC